MSAPQPLNRLPLKVLFLLGSIGGAVEYDVQELDGERHSGTTSYAHLNDLIHQHEPCLLWWAGRGVWESGANQLHRVLDS